MGHLKAPVTALKAVKLLIILGPVKVSLISFNTSQVHPNFIIWFPLISDIYKREEVHQFQTNQSKIKTPFPRDLVGEWDAHQHILLHAKNGSGIVPILIETINSVLVIISCTNNSSTCQIAS